MPVGVAFGRQVLGFPRGTQTARCRPHRSADRARWCPHVTATTLLEADIRDPRGRLFGRRRNPYDDSRLRPWRARAQAGGSLARSSGLFVSHVGRLRQYGTTPCTVALLLAAAITATTAGGRGGPAMLLAAPVRNSPCRVACVAGRIREDRRTRRRRPKPRARRPPSKSWPLMFQLSWPRPHSSGHPGLVCPLQMPVCAWRSKTPNSWEPPTIRRACSSTAWDRWCWVLMPRAEWPAMEVEVKRTCR